MIDYSSAATRHLHDAWLLFQPKGPRRFDNARYLAGYAVECGLKAAVQAPGVDARHFKHDLLGLHGEGFDLAMAMAPRTARYRPSPGDVHTVRERWSPDCRYERTAANPETMRQLAHLILEAADRVWRATVGAMVLDGLLEDLPR